MSYQNKYDQLSKQSSLLAKKMEEIKKKQNASSSSTSETKKSDNGGEEKKVALINNDGNFMENFLKMKNKKDITDASSFTKKLKPQQSGGPIAKKSRYSSMFQQMKKAKQVPGTAAETTLPYATATCFHGEDSSSSDEDKAPKSRSSTNRIAAGSSKEIRAAIINPVNATASRLNPIVSSTKPVALSAKPTAQPVVSESKPLTKERNKPRKNRWGEKVDLSDIAPPGLANMPGVAAVPTPQPSVFSIPQMSEAQKKQLQEQKEMQAMYSLIMANRNATQIMAQQQAAAINQKPKYEYDSDEEIDEKGGTWEHQKRRLEMEKTQALAEKLTDEAQGKHFIGDFLPPAELEKFMETFKALKEGRTPDYSDYKEFKIQCDNVGFKMLEKMGWSEGQGLGSESQGRTMPVNQGSKSLDGRGLGIQNPDNLSKNDDDFSAYRKRMMLAYKFRPNPLNNPRRPYY